MKQFNRSFLLSIFFLLLISFNLKAQIEDFKVGTTTRKMLVYAPTGIEPNRPLLISLHGMNQDIAYQQNQTKWETIAKANNFVVVYPGGINNSWDLYGTSDTNFILAIIDEMSKRYGIDRDRVYLSGFSMGGMMTYYAATKIADKIAAFAPVSGYLMGGPNTNSSRPIPIIHTHGTADDVVPFSGVSTCLNAWVKRNNCPATAIVTKPYPVGKTNGDAKYYWGPGTDSVEIVLLSLNGKGHWHSNDGNGVNTSQEIWNFCKKYSLSYGVSKFKYASVGNLDPTQIQVEFTLPIKKSTDYKGITVKVNGTAAEIDTIFLADSLHLAINLADSILNSNEITVSYSNGNILSSYDKKMAGFDEKIVENLLAGAPPRIVEMAVTEDGKVLKARFNKNMLLPFNISSLVLTAQFNGDVNIPITEYSYFNNDSTTIAFTLGEQVFADYNLLLTYSGNNFVAADSSAVKNLADFQITNKSFGLPVKIVSGALDSNAFTITLEFSKPMAMTNTQIGQFLFFANRKKVTAKEVSVTQKTIKFVLSNPLYYGDSIKVTYSPGNITAADKGKLEAFRNFDIANPIQEPAWFSVPGKIEAENYAMQYGTDTEQTGDTGGGLNVGWIETGDWLVYAIDNNSDKEDYKISFRLAAQSTGAVFDYYIDNVKTGQLPVPNTSGWQIWKSVERNITIPIGKHHLKIVVTSGAFNINHFDIQSDFTGIKEINKENVKIYHDKASSHIIIQSNDFQYNKIEIFDAVGKIVMSQKRVSEPVLNLSVNLESGIYLFRLSNEKEYQIKKISVVSK